MISGLVYEEHTKLLFLLVFKNSHFLLITRQKAQKTALERSCLPLGVIANWAFFFVNINKCISDFKDTIYVMSKNENWL